MFAYGPADATASKSKLVLPFWYWLTEVVLKKRPLTGVAAAAAAVHFAFCSFMEDCSTCLCVISLFCVSVVGDWYAGRIVYGKHRKTVKCPSICPSLCPIDRQRQLMDLLLCLDAGSQQISIDSCCCCATCGPCTFCSHCKDVQHTCFPWLAMTGVCLQCFDVVGWAAGRASGL